MNARFLLFGLLLLPLLLSAQNLSVRSGKFTVAVKGDWDPSFTGTNHYYLDDDGNKVWHGSAVVNQTKSHKDDMYSWGQYVDSYNDTRTYKANANYKHGHLDGAFSLSYNVNLTLRRNREYNTNFSISLSGRFTEGLLDGNWKLVSSGRQGSNKASNNIALVYNKGHLSKYDESSTLNGAADRNTHLSFKDDSIASGTYVSSDIDITLLGGVATDRYYDLEGDLYESSQTEQDIIRQFVNGEISIDDLAALGYTLMSYEIYNINKNLMDVVNDREATNYEFFLGSGDQMFSTISIAYKVLSEVRFTSYDEFANLMKTFSPELLDNIQQQLLSGNHLSYNYKTYYFAPATIQRLLDDIPGLKADAEKQIRNENRNYLEDQIKKALLDCRIELQEVEFFDNGEVKSASFLAHQQYSNGFGFSTRQCSIVNNAQSYNRFPSSDQVKASFANASLIHNDWDEVQSLYAKVYVLHDKVLKNITDAKFVDMMQSYTGYFARAVVAASRTDAASAQTSFSSIYDEQNRYLRLVELRQALIANNDIIANMDVKHGDNIKEAYLLYWSSLNKGFVDPSQMTSLQNSIDIQTRIIAALRSDNVKKLDKKVKKSDDKSIQTVLQLLQSE